MLPSPPDAGAPKIEWALWNASIGKLTGAFRVFRCEPDGKDPIYGEMWRTAATDDPATVRRMWEEKPNANIGLAVQQGFLVLDADLYKPGKEEALAEFERTHGQLPRSLEFNSARGGIHLTFRTGRNLGNGRGTLPEFGDVRGFGGYIVGPGSTFEGKPYTVEHVMPPVPLPKAIDERLLERRAAPPNAKELAPHVTLDDPVNQERFIKWLRHDALAWGSDPEDPRNCNDNLAATGAMGSSYGLSWDVTLGLMLDHWNPRCEPSWTDEQVEKHGGSGYRSATSRFGNIASKDPWLVFAPIPGTSIFKTMADITRSAPAREWAAGDDADGWVPLGGVTLILGPEGTGKSLLSQQWALAQARGEKLFDRISLRQMPVLLINCEDAEDEMHRRFENLGKRVSDPVTFASLIAQRTVLHPPFHLTEQTDTPFYRLLDEKLKAMGAAPKLLFLDNATHVFEGDPNKPSDVKRFQVEYLGRLARDHSTTIILFMHPSESARKSGAGTYGSVTWSAGVRSRLYFEFHTKPDAKRIGEERVLFRKKANYAKSGDETGVVVSLRDGKVFEPVAGDKAHLFTAAKLPEITPTDHPTLKAIGDAMLRALKKSGTRMSDRGLAKMVTGELNGAYQATVLRTKYFERVLGTGHEVCQYRDESGNGDKWQYR